MNVKDIDSPESESGIIATLIHNPDYSFYSENLLPNHFADRANRCMYTAICELARRNVKTVDAYNILEVLNSSPATRKLAEDITLERVQECIDMSDILCRNSLEEYKILVDNVLDAAFRRDTFRVLQDCMLLCCNRNETDVEKKIYDAIDDVMTDFSAAEEIPTFGD